MELTGKRFAVIGASGVLGSQIAEQLLAAGTHVYAVSHRNSLPDALAKLPHARADIRSRDELARAFTDFGGVFDGVINAAGVVAFGAVDEIPQGVVQSLFDVNAVGVINALSAAKPVLAPGGIFASLTGVAADVSVLGMSAYCASKAAAKTAMAVAAREWRRAGVRVIDVRAPHTETGLVNRALFGDAPKMPAGKLPQAVAARIVQAIMGDETDLPAEAFSE